MSVDPGPESDVLSESFQIENVLLQLVNKAVKVTKGDHSSVYLKEEGTTRYVLRDSTAMNPYIGNDFFTVGGDEKPKKCMGATKYCVVKEKSILIPRLHDCEYWSDYIGCHTKIGACELEYDKVGSFLAAPIIDKENDNAALKKDKKANVIGVIRVVRSNARPPFSTKNKMELQKLVDEMTPKISGALDISHLLEFGPIIDVKALCTKIVKELKKIINGRGCTIYLLVPEEKPDVKTYRCFGTTGLHGLNENGEYVNINDPFKEAYYDYRESESPTSFTTAAIKHKRNIIIRDFQNIRPEEADFEKNLDKPPRYVATYYRKKKGGGQELVPAGPSMYIPLFFPGFSIKGKDENANDKPDVMGVILINRPQGTKKDKAKEFTPQEQRMCINLSKRLSKIILISNYMSLLNVPINARDEDNIEGSLKTLIEQIREVTGTQRTTLYLKSVDGKRLERYIDTGNYNARGVYEFPESPGDYGEDKHRGYTLWVGIFNENLRFNYKNDPLKLNKKPVPVFSQMTERDGFIITEPDRFLGVPISTPDNVLGVLSSVKTMTDQPFSETDEMLFSSLATRLYPILNTLLDSRKRQQDRDLQLKKIFSGELIDKVKLLRPDEVIVRNVNKETDYIYKNIKSVTSASSSDDIGVSEKVRRSISRLWIDSGFDVIDSTLKSYELFNNQILSELPLYRDHFIHQYQVFLLGQYIIDRLNVKHIPFYKTYYGSIGQKYDDNKYMDKNSNIAWILTSTAHDIAYPIEKINGWMPKTIKKFIDPIGNNNSPAISLLSMENYLFSSKKFIELVDNLTDYLVDKELIKGISKNTYRSWIYNEIVRKKDHGALGSLYMLSSQAYNVDNITGNIVLSSALAISMHNLWKDNIKNNSIEYDKFPLLFLLIYCDTVQEWGRSCSSSANDNFVLKAITITKELDRILDPKKNPKEAKAIDSIRNNKTVFVCCDIEGKGDISYKAAECEQVMGMLSSRNPFFIIKLNGRPFISNTG